MPDESCRSCGGMLLEYSVCSECREPVKKICVKCGMLTSEFYHDSCFYQIEAYQTKHTFNNTVTTCG